jgi:hypothetical protein
MSETSPGATETVVSTESSAFTSGLLALAVPATSWRWLAFFEGEMSLAAMGSDSVLAESDVWDAVPALLFLLLLDWNLSLRPIPKQSMLWLSLRLQNSAISGGEVNLLVRYGI